MEWSAGTTRGRFCVKMYFSRPVTPLLTVDGNFQYHQFSVDSLDGESLIGEDVNRPAAAEGESVLLRVLPGGPWASRIDTT